MPARKLDDNLMSWASVIDDVTVEQARKTARLPILAGHVALMPDAHFGIGATVGSVIPTRGAVIPSAVGVDIGCGMIAAETDIHVDEVRERRAEILAGIAARIPSGVGKAHASVSDHVSKAFEELPRSPATEFSERQAQTARQQFGTLGSGNHFVEVCEDEREIVWVILHSGSRGIGNQLANQHIRIAKKLAKDAGLVLEDPDLAYLTQGSEEFQRYVADMLWAQDYAAVNRSLMADAALDALFNVVSGRQVSRINCHHNFTEMEEHLGETMWVTRKGAIRAGAGDLGLIPGSMGARSYIVRGLGNPLSYRSCAHGAGRALSRRKAREQIPLADLREAMAHCEWLSESAEALIDEAPAAYKPIDQVMADQSDLVMVVHELRQIVNYKGL